MNFFKTKTNIIFLFIIFLLVASLSGVSYFAYTKNTEYIATSANLSDNNVELDKALQKISELESKIEECNSKIAQNEQTNAELNAQLQSVIAEKEKLEKENNNLKEQITDLAEQKNRSELQKQIALKNIVQPIEEGSKICYLTFDDGPSENTLKILDILDAYCVKATFFVIGKSKIEYMPQITERGHAIGLHSATHTYSSIYANVDSYLADIQQISDIVYNATGVRSNIMRFPGGSSNKVSKEYCEGIMSELAVKMPEMGYSYYDWNVNSTDANASNVPAKTIVSSVLAGANGKDKICVLMHDTDAKGTTVEALPAIIEGLDAMGFRFAPLTADVEGFHQTLIN